MIVAPALPVPRLRSYLAILPPLPLFVPARFLVEVRHGQLLLVKRPMLGTMEATRRTLLDFVGIPVLHRLPKTSKLCALHKSFAQLVGSLRKVPAMHPLLTLRTLFVFAISKYDYVAHGVLLKPSALVTLQAHVHKVYTQAMCLPKWTPTASLQAPLSHGGAGSPSLT